MRVETHKFKKLTGTKVELGLSHGPKGLRGAQ